MSTLTPVATTQIRRYPLYLVGGPDGQPVPGIVAGVRGTRLLLPIDMPQETRILHLALQNDRLCLWALVDPSKGPERRVFALLETGALVPPGWVHRGTFVLTFGETHLFEEVVSNGD